MGSLAAAAKALAGAPSPAGSFTPPAPPADPAAFLARMLDLRGSVELARRLTALERPDHAGARAGRRAGVADAVTTEARARLAAVVAGRLDPVHEDIARALGDPFQRRNKLPTPEAVVAVLIDSGALLERRSRAFAAGAEAVWTPCGDLLARAMERVRFETAALREELGPPLAALGPAETQLERLDAALFGATIKGRQQLEDRLLDALARSFAAGFREAVAALPGATAPAHVAPWFAPDGILGAEMRRGRDVVLGVLGHERRRLDALIEAPSEGGRSLP